jgi:phosphatidate cytidylyltransferase
LPTRSIRIGNGNAGSGAGRDRALVATRWVARRANASSFERVLRLRVITALILAPLVVAALFLLPLIPFAAVFLALTGIGVFEWANLAGFKSALAKLAYVSLYAALAWIAFGSPANWLAVFDVVVLLWVLAALAVLTFPASAQWLPPPVLVPLGVVLFVGAWLALVALMQTGGPWLIVWLLFVVWGADVGAYFTGHAIGRRKLAVLVSPGKTWEGAFGGVALAVGAGTLLGAWIPALVALEARPARWAVAALALAVISVFGDLFESALKRARGVKDSGNIFPGHGGMLDRIDALIAALPCFALAVTQYV